MGSIEGVLRGSRACHAHADTAGTACVSCMCMAAYAACMCEAGIVGCSSAVVIVRSL